MANYKKLFTDHMDAQGVKYTDVNERSVSVSYSCDNIPSVKCYVTFDKDGEGLVQLRAWDIAAFGGDKYAKGLEACNQLNSKYRWVKFYLDEDKDVVAEMDAIIDVATAGEECLQLVRRMVNIVDEGYPVFMKTLWA